MMIYPSLSLKEFIKFLFSVVVTYLASQVLLPFGWLVLFVFVLPLFFTRLRYQYLFSVIYFAVNFYWFSYYWPLAFNLILYVYLALFWLLFWWIVQRVKPNNWVKAVVLSAVFVLVEFLRSLGPLGFISGSPAYFLWKIPQIFPLLRVGGIWLVNFCIIAINFSLYFLLRNQTKQAVYLSAFVILILLGAYLYDAKTFIPAEYRLKELVLTTNLKPKQKWQPAFAKNIENWYDSLIKSTLKDNPNAGKTLDFIIFPETAVASYLLKNKDIMAYYSKLAKRYGAVVVVGSKDYREVSKEQFRQFEFYNTAVVFYPDGRVLKHYKLHPVPFAERQIIKGLKFLSKSGPFENAGDTYTVFSHNKYPFSVLICYETTYPQLVKTFCRHGARLLINISNEGALSKSRVASMQLVRETLFRAVENNVLILKSANRGFSVVFYPDGEYNIIGDGTKNEATLVDISVNYRD